MWGKIVRKAYRIPVDKLLTYGECQTGQKWPDYLALGLKAEHIPELIRLKMIIFIREKRALWKFGPRCTRGGP